MNIYFNLKTGGLRSSKALVMALFMLGLMLTAGEVFAQSSGHIPLLTSQPGTNGEVSYSLSIQTLLVMTALSFIPASVLLMTSFTRIIIVLSLLRMAMGTQSTPPNQVLVGLALFLTFFVMSPVGEKIYEKAYAPLDRGQITMEQAITEASDPLKRFMLQQVRSNDLAMFSELAGLDKEALEKSPETLPMRVVIPAFATSEIKTAFQIGFLVFIPFLIIDILVASVLMSMGMMMVSPVMVALPFKIMLFVLIDGWNLLMGSIVNSFAG